jgi:transketolase C-terminal domain/subunit
LIPELQILNPSEARTAKESAHISLNFNRPTLVRLDKGAFDQPFGESKVGNGIVEHITVSRNLIIYTGAIGKFVKQAHETLQQNGDSWGVLELFQVSPLPHSLLEILNNVKRIVVVEENSVAGGLFSILAEEIVIRNHLIKVSRLGLRDEHIFKYGGRDWLSQNSGLRTLEKDIELKPGLNG